MPEITNRIRRLRFDHNEMTQEELANRTAVTRQTIHRAGGREIHAVAGLGIPHRQDVQRTRRGCLPIQGAHKGSETMNDQPVIRDERTDAVVGTSCRLAYLVLSLGC